jgi:hypothetical protein
MSRFFAHWCGRMALTRARARALGSTKRCAKRMSPKRRSPPSLSTTASASSARFQMGQVGHRVADVGEAWKTRLELRELFAALQIQSAVAGEHLVEELEMGRDPIGDRAIRRGGEHDFAAVRALLADVLDDILAIGEPCGVDVDARRDLVLQARAALQQPKGQQEHEEDVLLQEEQERLIEHVALDECAIEIDDEHRTLSRGIRRCCLAAQALLRRIGRAHTSTPTSTDALCARRERLTAARRAW